MGFGRAGRGFGRMGFVGGGGAAPLTLTYPAPGSSVDLDFENGNFRWGGEEHVLADLDDTTPGGKLLTLPIPITTRSTVLIEYDMTGFLNEEAEKVIVDLTNSAGTQRFAAFIRQAAAEHLPRVYMSAIGTPAYVSPAERSETGMTSQKAFGRQRLIWSHGTGLPASLLAGPFAVAATGTNAIDVSIDKLYIGHTRTATLEADNWLSLIKRVIIWPQRTGDVGLSAGVVSATARNITVLGDSFTNQQVLPAFSVASALQMGFTDAYRRISLNGVGGSTMEQQVARMAAVPDTWNDWIVWLDGGRSDAETVQLVQDLIDLVGHRRIVLLGAAPHTSLTIGTPERDAWDAVEAALEAAYPDLWVSTLPEAQALGDESTEDNDQIALGLWPVSLTVSDADFHPNADGLQFLADISEREIRAREGDFSFLFVSSEVGGWYDASDLSTLFQDSAGTVPVTAAGDPVGRWEDKSGNDYHLLQTTSGARAIYQTDGTYHWIETDGSAQWMKVAFASTATFTRISAIRQITSTANDRLFSGGAAQAGELIQIAGPSLRLQSGVNAATFTDLAVGADGVLTEVFAGAASAYAVGNNDLTTVNAGTNNPGGFSIGAGHNGSIAFNYGNARYYGIVMIEGALTPWVRQVRKYLAGLAGADL